MTFEQALLPNGLHIVGERNPGARSMAAGYFVRTGSRDETPEISGVSHFLEHMLFKGSDRRSADDVNREFDEIGAQYNAFTSEENTVYYGSVLPEFQGRVLDLLTDLLHPSLRGEDFEVEKKVILEEIALYEDRPRFTVMDLARELYFGSHTLGNRVLGTTGSITALQRDQMEAYFRRRYAPNNLSLVLTGNYDWDAALGQVEKATADWRPSDAPRALHEPAPRPMVRAQTTEKFNRAHLAMLSPGVSAQDERRYGADVIAHALGAAVGSRLYWALVDPGIAETASMAHSEEDAAGVYYTYVSCDPERAQEIVEIIRGVWKNAMDEGITAEELERAKRKLASGTVIRGETPFGRLLQVGFDWQYRRVLEPIDRTVDDLLAVPLSQVNALLATRPFETTTLVSLGPVSTLQ
jgi:predicted Zn-dependent peptidase